MTYEAGLNEAAKPAEGATAGKADKKTRAKTEDTAKSFPQFNADGTPKLGPDGKQEWGPTKFEGELPGGKKKRAKKEPEYEKNEDGSFKLDDKGEKILVKKERKPRKAGKFSFVQGDKPFDMRANQNDTTLKVVGTVTSKEGSKRSERAKAYEGATTVQDFFIKGGVIRDLLRHTKAGVVELTHGGKPVTVVAKAAPAPEPAPAAGEAGTSAAA